MKMRPFATLLDDPGDNATDEEAAPEGRTAVDISHQQAQQQTENDQGGDFLRVEDRSGRDLLRQDIDQPAGL